MKEWIHQYLQGQPAEAIGGPVPMSEIEDAEQELGVILPDDYKEFIHFYGSAGLPIYQILGLREAPFAYLTRACLV
ncbi:SMI1/KNR4 family protein, partial [Polycladomyces zharkentensis]